MTAPMPQSPTEGAHRAEPPLAPQNTSPGQLSGLVRDGARLARADVSQKAKRLGIGAELFGGAGLVAFLGLAVLITTAAPALDLGLPALFAAVIVAVGLFAVAGVQADIATATQGLSR
jgi:hypothetical protein